MEIFAIIFVLFMSVFIFAGGLDLMGEKARKDMWNEVTEKLFNSFEKKNKE